MSEKIKNSEFVYFLEHVGKDPTRLIFEDELTGIFNRRYLHHHLQFKIPWDKNENQYLSVIMMDIDHFKEINDTYGHQAGDEALICVANILKEVAGENGIAIRYAGDEFILLMPFQDKDLSSKTAIRLLERVRLEPFRIKGIDEPLKITLSIGVATTPMSTHAGKGLIQKADTALYYAKKQGRDRIAIDGDFPAEVIFAKTAIYQLRDIKIAGRQTQLEELTKALKEFSQRQNKFLIIKGAAGMGKTEFLEAIRSTLIQSNVFQVKTMGLPQEMYRPYYLITNIIISILNQKEDKGANIFEILNAKEISYLSNILPYLSNEKNETSQEDERIQREGLFNTLLRFIPKAVNHRPLILLIDDLDYGDEASLILFRRLMQRQDIPFFICGTCSESNESDKKNQMNALERFYENYHEELNMNKITLTPLTSEDITKHIQGIFSNAQLPENFAKEIEQVTNGNPLFLSEILRKLVQDQKIALVGQQWIIRNLEESYLPKSLEEIVSQKITSLDEENRQLLEHISALGEDVPLSTLIGSSGKEESKILEFIDQAMDQGLLGSDYQLNDETIRFLGKHILQITYGSIKEDRKQKMHERIGSYQETLYKKKLLPSAATLAYHFKRSADHERATKYEQFMSSCNQKIFNAQEAKEYNDEQLSDEQAIEVRPLDSESLQHIPHVVRHLLTALRNIKLYPKGSQPIINSIQNLKENINLILENNDLLSIGQREQILVINEEETEIEGFRSAAQELLKFLDNSGLKEIIFLRDLPDYELETFLDVVRDIKSKVITPGYWERLSSEHGLHYIRLNQMRYTMTEGDESQAKDQESLDLAHGPESSQLLTPSNYEEQDLKEEELSQIMGIIRDLLRASKNVKLYPLESKAISDSITLLMQALQNILINRPVFSLSRVNNALLFNGIRLDVSDFETLAGSFMKFLEGVQINSITFLKNITIEEIKSFIGEVGQISDVQIENDFWNRFAKDKMISNIIFNRHLYEIMNAMEGGGEGEDPEEAKSGAETDEEHLQEEQEEEIELPDNQSFASFLKKVQKQLTDLLLKDDKKMLQKTIKRLFKEFHGQEPTVRQEIIKICRSMMQNLTLATQHRFSELLTEPMIEILIKERDPKILVEIANLFKTMVSNFIQFAEYQPASRILYHLHRYHKELQDAEDENALVIAKALEIDLDSKTQKLILDDLKSTDMGRQTKATELLGSLGDAVSPLLIDLIKQEQDLRLRKMAITLLQESGTEAGQLLKRELLLEIKPEERVRILEVIDSLNADLKDDLVFVLGDKNPYVRQAAFQLAERINDQYVIELLLDYAKNKETTLATAAIRCLGRLKIQSVGERILSILNSTKDDDRLIACCRALGQIGDPACIDPLADILTPKGFFSFHRKHSNHVRAAAASALAQIKDPKGPAKLAVFQEDPDPRIRHIAKKALNKS